MEYNFSVPGLEDQAVTTWDAGALVQLNSVDFHKLRNLLEDFGQRSAVAQGLRAPITDIWRLRSSDQRLYLHTAAAPAGCCIVLGGLKVGRKKLFLHRANGRIVQVQPLCVLDFYVHESHQRQGVGRALFEYMLEAEQQGPEQLGYDRPSGKLLAFLKKHYGLASYVPQPNNFVVFEQFYEHMPGSPGWERKGSTGGGGSTSSSACWGPGALASLGHGRQTLHVIGSRAAAVTGTDPGAADTWVRTSARPPTASLQHCVQLHTTQAGSSSSSAGGSSMCTSSLGGSSACSTTTSAGGTAAMAWSPLGGPGCPSAGTPTRKGEWEPHSPASDTHHQQQVQQQLAAQAPVRYSRGTGIKLMQGSTPADTYSHKGYQQALLAAAANPVPPRIQAGPLLPNTRSTQQASWQHQQQYGSLGGTSCDSRQDGCRDSLDQLVVGLNSSSSTILAPEKLPHQAVNSAYDGSSGGSSSSSSSFGGGVSGPMNNTWGVGGQQPQYAPTRPFGSWEPQPGSLLPTDSVDSSRVSLRRQAMQQEQQRLQQQKPAWVAAGAGPPGHLLAAPTGSYAVPTADMAELIGSRSRTGSRGCQEQQQQQQSGWGAAGSGSGSGRCRQVTNSLCLSWDGLPQGVVAEAAGRLGVADGGGSSSSNAHWGTSGLSESRAAAAAHRSGRGAASCMRMV